MSEKNLQVVLARRPRGAVQESDFRFVEGDVPEPGEGEFAVRTHYLSLDPDIVGCMGDARSYAKPVEIGPVMTVETVGEVIASRHPQSQQGDKVAVHRGWQLYSVDNGQAARRIEDESIPLSAWLGVVGMP